MTTNTRRVPKTNLPSVYGRSAIAAQTRSGTQVRPKLSAVEIVEMLAEVGAYGVNFHDNDLVPIDATPTERDKIVGDFKKACEDNDIKVPMATVNLFYEPVFRDGAFTANDAKVRAYAIQKTMRAMDLGKECGADIFVLWGGREGTETDACRRPDEAIKRLREAINYLCEYNIKQKYGYKFAMEAKPNEPRADIYMADDDGLSRLYRNARTQGNGRCQPRSRARTDARTEYDARRRAGLGSRKNCFTLI